MRKKNNAFTLIELLVVISILGIFAVIAYPNVIKWINDREVKAEAIKTAGYLNEMQSTVKSGKYGMVQVTLQTDVYVYTMSNENFRNTYKNLSTNNTYKRNKLTIKHFKSVLFKIEITLIQSIIKKTSIYEIPQKT